jgi:hypothetical protein
LVVKLAGEKVDWMADHLAFQMAVWLADSKVVKLVGL